jgi:phosphatidate phosphatase LPIN
LTWDNAAPVLASLAIYQKSISSPSPVPESLPGDKPSKGSVGRSWSRWFSKSKSDTNVVPFPTSDSRPTSPPPSHSDTDVNRAIRSRSPSLELPLDEADTTIGPDPLTVHSTGQDSRHFAKTLRLTSDQLKTLDLQHGVNTISFSVSSSYSRNTVKCSARIFLWDSDYKIVVSDIDGTITKFVALRLTSGINVASGPTL